MLGVVVVVPLEHFLSWNHHHKLFRDVLKDFSGLSEKQRAWYQQRKIPWLPLLSCAKSSTEVETFIGMLNVSPEHIHHHLRWIQHTDLVCSGCAGGWPFVCWWMAIWSVSSSFIYYCDGMHISQMFVHCLLHFGVNLCDCPYAWTSIPSLSLGHKPLKRTQFENLIRRKMKVVGFGWMKAVSCGLIKIDRYEKIW